MMGLRWLNSIHSFWNSIQEILNCSISVKECCSEGCFTLVSRKSHCKQFLNLRLLVCIQLRCLDRLLNQGSRLMSWLFNNLLRSWLWSYLCNWLLCLDFLLNHANNETAFLEIIVLQRLFILHNFTKVNKFKSICWKFLSFFGFDFFYLFLCI